jgi:hypothetical protein
LKEINKQSDIQLELEFIGRGAFRKVLSLGFRITPRKNARGERTVASPERISFWATVVSILGLTDRERVLSWSDVPTDRTDPAAVRSGCDIAESRVIDCAERDWCACRKPIQYSGGKNFGMRGANMRNRFGSILRKANFRVSAKQRKGIFRT